GGAGVTRESGHGGVGAAHIRQMDPEVAIRENRVAEQGVVDGGVVMHPASGKKGTTAHQIAPAVEGNDVACVRVGAAHGVVVPVNEDPARVAQRLCAGDIGADDVALDEGAGGAGCEDHTSVANVA